MLKTLTVERSKRRNTLFYQEVFVDNITLCVDSITENDMIIFKKLNELRPLILLTISKNNKNNTLFLNKDDELKFYPKSAVKPRPSGRRYKA